jgi:hypothetical protein
LSALQLFNHELLEEIISEIAAQIQKREQLRALTIDSEGQPKEEENKVDETLNHK